MDDFTADEGDGLEVFAGCLLVAIIGALCIAAYFAAGLLNGH